MNFKDFSIRSYPEIVDACCKICKGRLKEVSDGLMASALFCPTCERVYQIKLVKIPKKRINKEYLKQCKEEAK